MGQLFINSDTHEVEEITDTAVVNEDTLVEEINIVESRLKELQEFLVRVKALKVKAAEQAKAAEAAKVETVPAAEEQAQPMAAPAEAPAEPVSAAPAETEAVPASPSM